MVMEKILIVDNDEGLLHFLSRFFSIQGFEVNACKDGQSALDILDNEQFDLIMMDYKMPEMNGLDILKVMKKSQVKTPIIIMTAYGTVSAKLDALNEPIKLVDIPTQDMTLFAQGLRRDKPLLRSCLQLSLGSMDDRLIIVNMQPVCSDDCDIFTDEVKITKVEWKADREELKVHATSSEQPDAILTVVGFGEMTYK